MTLPAHVDDDFLQNSEDDFLHQYKETYDPLENGAEDKQKDQYLINDKANAGYGSPPLSPTTVAMRNKPGKDISPVQSTSETQASSPRSNRTTSFNFNNQGSSGLRNGVDNLIDTVQPPTSPTSSSKPVQDTAKMPVQQNEGYPSTLGRRRGAQPTAIRRAPVGVKIGPTPPTSGSKTSTKSRLSKAAKLYYKYADIKAHDQIRLLKIQCRAESPDDDIIASLVIISFKDLVKHRHQYDALSYHWGSPSDEYQNEVYLRNIDEQKHLEDVGMAQMATLKKPERRYMAKPNLYNALLHLRPIKKEDEFFIWIDAICINQNNDEEKQIQVARMTQIYTMAGGVIIWLGVGDASSNRAMSLIPTICGIANSEEEDDLVGNEDNTRKWSDLAELMKRSWFSRRWVIQEIALARDAVVHCGEKEVHWRDFKDAISFFVMHFDAIKELFFRSQEFKHNANAIGDLHPLGAKVLVDETTNIFRRNASGHILEPIRSLESLVCSLPTFDSADARDTIYALQNISRENPRGVNTAVKPDGPPFPYPDYKKSIVEVYTEFVDWVVTSSRSLDIICRQWALVDQTEKPVLPSWIQEVTNSQYGSQKQARGRKNGDSFVGLPGYGCYRASHRETTINNVRSETVVGSNSGNKSPHDSYPLLCVKGIKIGVLRWSSDPIADGVIPKKGLKKGGWVNHDVEEVVEAPDKLWRTLVADRGPDGQNPPSWYHRACLQCLVMDTSNGHINCKELLNQKQTSMVTDFLRRVSNVTWNRKFIEADPSRNPGDGTGLSDHVPRTPDIEDLGDSDSELGSRSEVPNGERASQKEGRLFGLGPPRAKVTDIVCILFGCTVPCILRETAEKGQYVFIGEAYIYGKMDGEAVNELEEADLKSRTMEFKIR
ncbi:hypothetical protein IFR04_008776 [Cadophora malorum]|uniref:Heterokaryon incompatibility domain-containing protein n=1 Tax=Cadophora malorum TaxID=108018 RepID=A0A8H7TFD3_9HELO|nr:hypothetical protein IFR04_008776 [Cadophora malorum]